MHPEAWHWLQTQVYPGLAQSARVFDCGGSNVNGSPRSLFSEGTQYVVLDARSTPDVDIVADAVRWSPPRELRGYFDVALCTEVFEHVEQWRGILYNLWLVLRPGGVCLVTCATEPRRPHSIVGVEPPPAGEWYGNVAAGELLAPMRLLFRQASHAIHPRGDLYARGLR